MLLIGGSLLALVILSAAGWAVLYGFPGGHPSPPSTDAALADQSLAADSDAVSSATGNPAPTAFSLPLAATASPTAAATITASPTAAATITASPTASATLTVTAPPTATSPIVLTTEEQALIAILPEQNLEPATCVHEEPYSDARVSVRCTARDLPLESDGLGEIGGSAPAFVTYDSFLDSRTLQDTLDDLFTEYGATGTADCANDVAGQDTTELADTGQATGRLGCFYFDDQPWLIWWERGRNIVGTISGDERLADLYRWWRGATRVGT